MKRHRHDEKKLTARVADPASKPPTPAMLQVLQEIDAGLGTHHGLTTMASYGGRSVVLIGLRVRGLIDDENKITPAGEAVTAAIAALGVAS